MKSSSLVVKEATEKREAAVVLSVLWFESIMAGMILIMLLCES